MIGEIAMCNVKVVYIKYNTLLKNGNTVKNLPAELKFIRNNCITMQKLK